jgi:methyl coenzyme M reductase subunit D
LKNIERLEKEFKIKGRTDFLKTAEEIFELEIPQKVVVFGRTLPANTLFFPFKGRGTDFDTPKVIDWKDLTESVKMLKKILL